MVLYYSIKLPVLQKPQKLKIHSQQVIQPVIGFYLLFCSIKCPEEHEFINLIILKLMQITMFKVFPTSRNNTLNLYLV